MANDPKFALWVRMQSGYEAKAQAWVSKMMDEKYIKTEVHDEKGRWVDMVEESWYDLSVDAIEKSYFALRAGGRKCKSCSVDIANA